jgi:hypothetical protein
MYNGGNRQRGVSVRPKGRGTTDPGVTPVGSGAGSHYAVVAVAGAVWFEAWRPLGVVPVHTGGGNCRRGHTKSAILIFI